MARLGARNLRTVWYATYKSSEEIVDEWGNETGEYDLSYNEPVPIKANVSPAKGQASVEMFGTDEGYSKTMIVSDMGCPIDEQTILWIDTEPVIDDIPQPHNYVVKLVAKSLTNIAYAIKKGDVK